MLILLPVIAALSGAIAVGLFQLLAQKRRLREESRLLHIRRQIEELYGPLNGLIQYGAAINEIEQVRLPAAARDETGRPLDEEGGKVIRFFREHYYLPLNAQMVELIRTKIYLLDSDAVPKSFTEFIRHAAQLDAFHRLWKETNISSHGIKPVHYPAVFKSDVETTLNTLRQRYNAYTGGSKERRTLLRRIL